MYLVPINGSIDVLRQLTTEQFRHLGTRQVVYLKSDMIEGEQAITIYGADGTLLEVVDEWETAMATLVERGMGFATVH